MNKISVLFVCIHNSARSQMAEAFLKHYGNDNFDVESAGIEPGNLNPLVVEVIKEVHIDISGNKTKDVSEFLKQGRTFSYVVTVCDETSAERCPMFPGNSIRMHWGFRDPSTLQGTDDEKKSEIRKIRDDISLKIQEWVKSININV